MIVKFEATFEIDDKAYAQNMKIFITNGLKKKAILKNASIIF